MVERAEPRRGEIWWAAADKRRPVVVVQADFLNRSAGAWILCVPLTTNLGYTEAPGNVRLPKRETKLPRPSVANVGQVAPLHRMSFSERVSCLTARALANIDEGLRLVMDLSPRP